MTSEQPKNNSLRVATAIPTAVICPLAGALVAPRNRGLAFLSGLGGALALSTLAGLSREVKPIYTGENPISSYATGRTDFSLGVYTEARGMLTFMRGVFISPLVVLFDRDIVTKAYKGDRELFAVEGDNVISFNRETGRYDVSLLDHTTRFSAGVPGGSLSSINEEDTRALKNSYSVKELLLETEYPFFEKQR